MERWLAVTWFDHRRTTELCEGLGIELASITTRRKGLARYLELTLRTIPRIVRSRPKVLLVQNPSLVLAVLMVLLRPLVRYRLVVDAHNEAVEPYINRSERVVRVTQWVLQKADLTIVTNRFLGVTVSHCGGRAFALPDRIPRAPAARHRALPGAFRLILIATFAPDEPIEAVFDAVKGMEVAVFVTGNHKKARVSLVENAPSNVTFTGFLSEDDYWEYLASADAVVDLTTMPNCLVCGGYEAAALAKPLVLTHSPAAVELFGEAAVYTDNSAADIRRAIEDVKGSCVAFGARMRERRVELDNAWRIEAARLVSLLNSPQPIAAP
jgi:glycosyltransferase involved in cell wall biosynthesis